MRRPSLVASSKQITLPTLEIFYSSCFGFPQRLFCRLIRKLFFALFGAKFFALVDAATLGSFQSPITPENRCKLVDFEQYSFFPQSVKTKILVGLVVEVFIRERAAAPV